MEVRPVQSLFNVKLPGKSIRSHAAVVENAVGHIGILLNLRNDQTCANGVECAGRDKKDISTLDRDGAEDLGQGSVRCPAGQFPGGDFLPEAVVERTGESIYTERHRLMLRLFI